MGMNTPHTMAEQLKAALERTQELEIDLHTAKVERLLAERRARIAAERSDRNLPDTLVRSDDK